MDDNNGDENYETIKHVEIVNSQRMGKREENVWNDAEDKGLNNWRSV